MNIPRHIEVILETLATLNGREMVILGKALGLDLGTLANLCAKAGGAAAPAWGRVAFSPMPGLLPEQLRKIQGIKLIRDRARLGLKESKEVMDGVRLVNLSDMAEDDRAILFRDIESCGFVAENRDLLPL